MSDSDEDRVRDLVRIIRDPATYEETRLACIDELLDMCDPELVAELARLDAFDALEAMTELARTAKYPEVRREAEQAVVQCDRTRQDYIRKITGDD